MVRKLLGALAVAGALAAVGAGAGSAGLIGVNEDATKFAEDGGASLFKQMQGIGLQQNVISAIWTSGRQLSATDSARIQKAVTAGKANGVKVVIALYPASGANARALAGDSGGFLDFVKQVVGTFHGSVKDVIVLNEPNRTIFNSPVDPALTAKVLADSYDAIKAIDSSVNVIGLGLSPRGSGNGSSLFPVQFLAQLGAAYKALNRSAPLMDAISFHPYPFPEDKAPARTSDWPTIGLADLARFKQAVSDAFTGTGQKTVEQGLPIHLDEVAYQVPTDGKGGYTGGETVKTISEADQATYYAQIVQQVACDSSIASLSFFHFVDETDRAAFQSGFLDAGLGARPVGDAVQSALASTSGGSRCTGTPVSWKPVTGVVGFDPGFGSDGKTTIKSGKIFGFSATAEEDASFSASLFATDAKGAPTGKPRQTVTGKIPAMLNGLAKFDLKGKNGKFAYTVTATSVTTPTRTETATSGAFSTGSGRPSGTTTAATAATGGGGAKPRISAGPTGSPAILTVAGDVFDGIPAFSVHSEARARSGNWLGNPRLALAWLRCAASGAGCSPIAGATALVYRLEPADQGKRLRFRVTATNGAGSTVFQTNLTPAVTRSLLNPPQPLRNSDDVAPTITAVANPNDRSAVIGHRVGSLLSGFSGRWHQAESLTLVWQRCTSATACTPIAGASSTTAVTQALSSVGTSARATYVLTAADQGKRLRLDVTATNIVGSIVAKSTLTPPIGAASTGSTSTGTTTTSASDQAPSLQRGPRFRPTVSETIVDGEVNTPGIHVGSGLFAERGTWEGSPPPTRTHVWLRCSGGVETCTPISGATGVHYQLGSLDRGKRIRIEVTATNRAGTTKALSEPTPVVQAAPAGSVKADSAPSLMPAQRFRPGFNRQIEDGRPARGWVPGTTLDGELGGWNGTPKPTLTPAWLRCPTATSEDGCEPIAGATRRSYTLATADAGSTIRLRVTATNKLGSATFTTAASPKITTG